ncbi:MAG: cyclase family protein [Bacteroidia bacterium]
MIVNVEIEGINYTANLNEGVDVSIAVGGKSQVKAYGIPDAQISVYVDGGFVGDVSQGGSCNVRDIKFNPHGNGTHTECIGHVSTNYVEINSINTPSHFTANLITADTNDCITKEHLIILKNQPKTKGLIIRTLPNNEFKLQKDHTGSGAIYIHPEAMAYILELGVEHLIVDLPSVDHETDPDLKSHKIFWNLNSKEKSNKTITELVYIPTAITDGLYLVNLMLPNMHCDAVPSKPMLYALR